MSETEFSLELNRSVNALKNYAYNLTNDEDDAKDLIQETLIKAYRSRNQFKIGTNLKGWLFIIMKNTYINTYNQMLRKKTFIDTTQNAYFINSSESNVSNTAISSLTIEELDNIVETIPEIYSKPFMMYFRGFKYHEIATRFQLPMGTVKNRIHIARKMLKENINKLYNEN